MKKVVVDVGCGTGGNLALLAGEYRCLGIDPSPEAIELARSRFPQVEFLQATMENGNWRQLLQEADLVLMTDVLEHVPDDSRFLSAVVGACRPGTSLLITVPANPALMGPHDVALGHFRRYTEDRFRRLWDRFPVKTVLLSYFNARLYPLIWAVRILSRRLGRTMGEGGTDFFMPGRFANRFLERIFASESGVLLSLLEGKRSRGFSRGLSLVGILQLHGRLP